MDHQIESQKRRGISKDDLICKIYHISFTAFSSELLYCTTGCVKVKYYQHQTSVKAKINKDFFNASLNRELHVERIGVVLSVVLSGEYYVFCILWSSSV